MESETWQVFGYKGNKGKRPRNMGKLYFGEVMNKDRALKAAQNIFCFSTITDVAATRYTKWDTLKEGLHDMRWLWIPAVLIISGFILSIHFNLIWPIIIGWGVGLSYGISHAPHTPV